MIQRMRPFLLIFLFGVLVGAWLLIFHTKAALLLAVNGHHDAVGDALMPYVTDGGTGVANVVLLLLLIAYARWKKGKAEAIRWGWLGILVFAIPSTLSQLCKMEFFHDVPRPTTYFAATPWVLHHVSGVPVLLINSFPSGHTVTAFSMALLLMYLVVQRRPWCWAMLLFGGASLVGYSRMYLAQHFFADVYGGACIGVVATVGSIWWGERTLPFRSAEGAVRKNGSIDPLL